MLVAAVVAIAAAAAVAGVLLTRGGGHGARYGQLPSWLPKPSVATGRVVQASAAHPQLAIQGDSISVHLSTGRVRATTVGPEVPEDGAFPVPATSPCSFTVTLTSASGVVPVRADAFTILDELGHLHRPRVTTATGRPLPPRVVPGQTITLKVSGILPTGGGQLRWTPEGTRAIASWDFDVEID